MLDTCASQHDARALGGEIWEEGSLFLVHSYSDQSFCHAEMGGFGETAMSLVPIDCHCS